MSARCPPQCLKRRIQVRSEQWVHSLKQAHLECASFDKLKGEDGSALLHQAVAVGRHGAGCDAAHISVMAPRCHKEYELALTEHWGDDCDVWQM